MNIGSNELISIIITTHKGSATVCRAVDSVLAQDYSAVEIIVIDDNGRGTDEQIATEEVLYEYIRTGKIIYHAHEKNKNGSAARNTGVSLSKGIYIGLLDDDDTYKQGKISKSIGRLCVLSDEWGGVYSDVEIDYGDRGIVVNRYHKEGNILYEMLTHTIYINPSVLIMRKNAYEMIGGFDERFSRHQDWEFNARFAERFKIAHINTVGSTYNCQIKRHYNPSLATRYRTFYIQEMKPVISKLSVRKQKIVYYKNAIEICGFSIKKYTECRELVKDWGGIGGIFSFYSALFITACERIKARLSKA